MNRIVSILFVCLMQASLAVASTYNLRVEVTPDGAGTLNTSSGVYEEGASVYLRTYKNTGFVFKGWFDGDSLLSSATSFYYTMPARDAAVQARYEYDPTVPDNPAMPDTATYYLFTASVSPDGAGTLNISSGKYAQGADVYVRTYANTGFQFVGWEDENGEILSTNTSYHYSMPGKNAHLTAVYNYDPTVPANPDSMGVQRRVSVVCKPVGGGSFNVNNTIGTAGSNVRLYAYTNTGFKFLYWENEEGDTLSSEQNFYYVIPDKDSKVYGVFEYDPAVPGNPNNNYWNKELGEIIVDDFAPGGLSSAVSSAISGSSRNDVAMIIVAGRMNDNDFGIANNYENCTLLDLSRVTGVSEIPSYAFDYTNLETVYLPATIEVIGYRAFADCQNLSSLTCYAMTPPVLEDYVFENVPEGLVVYVPAAVIAQYQDSETWKDFTLLPIQDDVRSLIVNLPTGTNVEDYKQMWIELLNTKSGQKLHYVMTDRQSYTFPNLIRNTTWNVTIRNEEGDILGKIENVEVKDEDITVNFSSLLKPQTVQVKVLTPDNEDVTPEVKITWTGADGKYLGYNTSLNGLIEGKIINWEMVLPQNLAMKYVVPAKAEFTVKSSDNIIECKLEDIPSVVITGKVIDMASGQPLKNAVISASQTFAEKYSKTINDKTDAKGLYKLEIFDVPTVMSFSASDYISQNINCDSLIGGKDSVYFEDTKLKAISGAVLTVGFTYTSSVAENETPEFQDWYNDYNNVQYAIYNKTKDRQVSQFNVQYPQIVLLEEVDENDELQITATSINSSFMPVVSTATINEQKADVAFDIYELGQVSSSFNTTTNASVVGILYDDKGKYIKSYNYSNASLTIGNLADGNYILVAMGNSQMLNTIYDLSQYEQSGLVAEKDYVLQTVEVKSGVVSHVVFESVPKLDESKFFYTSSGTSFSVNKSSIVAGNYLTLTGKIDFKPEYTSAVSNIQMIVDIPESCQFVENSVMVGNSTSSYVINDNRLTIPMARYTDRVRFCVLPTKGGDYAPSAFVQFDLKDKTINQPIGSAHYTAKDLSISVPKTVAKTTVPVSGTAIGQSKIEIFDNGVKIGETTSLANGVWNTTCDLNEPYNLSTHNVYAKVTTKQGLELQSETQECMYDMNAIEVRTVTMSFYNGWLKKDVEVVFDFENNKTSDTSYMFYTGTDITFVADLTNNDTTVVSDVKIYVFTDRDEVRELPATYDAKNDKWVAVSRFESNNLPINVSVDFDAEQNFVVDREWFGSGFEIVNNIVAESTKTRNRIWNEYITEIDTDSLFVDIDCFLENDSIGSDELKSLLSKIHVISDSFIPEDVSLSQLEEKINKLEKEYASIADKEKANGFVELVDNLYGDVDLTLMDSFTESVNVNNGIKKLSITDCTFVDVDSLTNSGYSYFPLTDGSSVYFKLNGVVFDVIDVSKNKRYKMEIFDDVKLLKARSVNWGYVNCGQQLIDICVDLISLKDKMGDDRTQWVATINLLNKVVQLTQCYYQGFREVIEYNFKQSCNILAAQYDGLLKDAQNNLDKLVYKLSKQEEEFKALSLRQHQLIDDRTEIENSSALTSEQKKYKLESIEKELDEVVERKLKLYDEKVRTNSLLKKAKKNHANLEKHRKLIKSMFDDFMKELDKMPRQLTKNISMPKWLHVSGKLAGEFGVMIQVASLYLDVVEIIDEENEWIDLADAIDRMMPCEGNASKASDLQYRIHNDLIGNFRNNLLLLSGEIGAIGFSAAGGIPVKSPTWWAESLISIACEWGKMFNANASLDLRSQYWGEVARLKCNDEDKCPKCGKDPCECEDKCPECGSKPCKCHNKCPKCRKNPCVCKPPIPPVPPVPPIRDPSGYVYEAVSSNRVEGVMASCYYKEMVEDMYGDLHENIVLWDAEQYAQENPLFTDENGMYRWDVPQGLWQVKFEKEGYETTYSEWLPVPPPQLEVNIPMKQNVQPNVKSARAFENAVEVQFDKYMMPEMLTTENIMVLADENVVEGTIELLDEEISYEGKSDKYASKIRFNAKEPFSAEEVTLIVKNRVKSYAGIRMQDDYSQNFIVELEIRKIECDSVLAVIYGEQSTIMVQVHPASAAEGKTLKVKSLAPLLLSVDKNAVTLDAGGKAEITISGDLPGTAALMFEVDGHDISATSIVKIGNMESLMVATPTTSIASGSEVAAGTEIYLSCATENATIYYTLDGTCPCENTSSVIRYDGTPIVINETTTIKAIAYAEGMYESEVATFVYTVNNGSGIDEEKTGKYTVYPQLVKDIVNIDIPEDVSANVCIASVHGQTVYERKNMTGHNTVDMTGLKKGMYVVAIRSGNELVSIKIIKIGN